MPFWPGPCNPCVDAAEDLVRRVLLEIVVRMGEFVRSVDAAEEALPPREVVLAERRVLHRPDDERGLVGQDRKRVLDRREEPPGWVGRIVGLWDHLREPRD